MTRSGIKDILIILFILLVCSSCGKRGGLLRPKFSTVHTMEKGNNYYLL